MQSFWSNVAGASLRQGDYLLDCPIPVLSELPSEIEEQSFPIAVYDLIVMTQSCDLENKKAMFVALCPIHTLTEFEKLVPFSLERKNGKRCGRGESKDCTCSVHSVIRAIIGNLWSLIFEKFIACHSNFSLIMQNNKASVGD
jgi:hypothetical protein